MADEEKEKEEVESERKKLKELGVGSTWDILADLSKKKKED